MYIRSYVEAATTAALTWSQFLFGSGHTGHHHHEVDFMPEI